MKKALLGSIGAIALFSFQPCAQEAQGLFGESEAVGANALGSVRGQNNPNWQQQLQEELKKGTKNGIGGLTSAGSEVGPGTVGGFGYSERSIADNHLDGAVVGNGTPYIPSDTGNVNAAFGAGAHNSNTVKDGMVDAFIAFPLGGRDNLPHRSY